MANIITVHIDEDEEDYHATASKFFERNRWLNREAVAAGESTRRWIESIGGLEALEHIQRAQELAEYKRVQTPFFEYLQRLDVCWPGASNLLEMVDERHNSDKSDFMAAANRFARTLDSRLVDQEARRVLTDNCAA